MNAEQDDDAPTLEGMAGAEKPAAAVEHDPIQDLRAAATRLDATLRRLEEVEALRIDASALRGELRRTFRLLGR